MPGLNSTADSTAVPFDPYELKDVVGGTIRNPYPAMHALRRQSPVHVGPIDLGEGAEIADPSKPAPVTVFGFDEVVQVLRDNETYSSKIYEEIMGMVMGRTILQMDEPEHRAVRTLVAGSFRSKILERWEEDLVARVVNELIDTFIDDGRTDLVRSVTFNFPAQVIARILGLPREDYSTFQRWTLELTSVAANWDRGIAASNALRDYFAGVMAERRATPGDDLISDLVRAEVDGEHLTDEEIFSFLRLLLPAGVETTYRATGQHAVRPSPGPRPVRRALRGSLALRSGLRGGRALGAAGDGDSAPGDPRHRVGRRRHLGGGRHCAPDRCGQP